MTTSPASTSEHPVTVLLVDDQAIIAEAVRRMLAAESDIQFHYCNDPTKAMELANHLAPTVILQDLVMPEIDGLTLVKFFRANPKTRDVPMIVLSTKEEPTVKAQAFAVGANDYLVKLPDKLELIARIRYHSKGYIAQLERNEAYRRLAESRKQLADEIEQAARYVSSLLPAPLTDGPLRVAWRFVPSTQLGGDSFGYRWLDDDHFSVYLLDVSGHGVGASLLSVSAMNLIASQSLPNVDFRDPGQVLHALSATFDMEKHDNKYFTIWYGVFQKSRRRLLFAGGGHPPALLIAGPCEPEATSRPLESQGPMIGMGIDLPFDTAEVELPEFAQLYLYSDGAFEIHRPDGSMWSYEEMAAYLDSHRSDPSPIDRLLEHIHAIHGPENLEDDFSMIEVRF